MYIKPTLTADQIGYDGIESFVRLKNCTDPDPENCKRQTGGNIIINTIQSALLNTKKSFSFKSGRLEVIAKMPIGDWLWPGMFLSIYFSFLLNFMSGHIKHLNVHQQYTCLVIVHLKRKKFNDEYTHVTNYLLFMKVTQQNVNNDWFTRVSV